MNSRRLRYAETRSTTGRRPQIHPRRRTQSLSPVSGRAQSLSGRREPTARQSNSPFQDRLRRTPRRHRSDPQPGCRSRPGSRPPRAGRPRLDARQRLRSPRHPVLTSDRTVFRAGCNRQERLFLSLSAFTGASRNPVFRQTGRKLFRPGGVPRAHCRPQRIRHRKPSRLTVCIERKNFRFSTSTSGHGTRNDTVRPVTQKSRPVHTYGPAFARFRQRTNQASCRLSTISRCSLKNCLRWISLLCEISVE